MNFVDIILDKRYGRELSDEQISFFIKGVTDRSIPDYQISALLMAIVLNGMTDREMTTLTMEMTPDILPLLNAVNSPDAYVGIPLNTKDNIKI